MPFIVNKLDQPNQGQTTFNLTNVKCLYLLIHPGFLMDDRQLSGMPAALLAEIKAIGQQMLPIYLNQIAQMSENDVLILFAHESFSDLKQSIIANRPFIDIYRQIQSALGKRLFVYTEGSDPSQKFPNQLKARGFKINPATVPSLAYGEYVDACVVSYSSRVNQALGLNKKTIVLVNQSAKFNKDKSVDSIETPSQLTEMLKQIQYTGEHITLTEKASNAVLSFTMEDGALGPIISKLFKLGFEFDEETEDKIRVTVQELCLNSSIACHESEDLVIKMKFYYGEKGLVVDVADQGLGFDHQAAVFSASKKTNLNKESVLYGKSEHDYPGGTGLYCLLNFANAFQHNQKGNRVIARFDLTK